MTPPHPPRPRVALVLVLVAVAAAGCAASFRPVDLPLTANGLARDARGEALVAYLTQPGASGAVCDPASRGPHVARLGRLDADALVDGLAAGDAPDAWRRCVEHVAPTLRPTDAAELFDRMGRAYESLLRDRALDRLPGRLAALDALARVYADRPAGYDGTPDTMRALSEGLRSALARPGALTPEGARRGRALLAVIELDRGRLDGAPVTTARLDALAEAGDEPTLALAARRLREPSLRSAALRALVRVRIARSPFAEVRAHADEVERVVLAQGRNPVALDAHAPLGATIDPTALPRAGLAIVQVPRDGAAARVADGLDDRALPRVVPLRRALRVTVAGLASAVTVCRAADAYDPTPCLRPDDVAVDGPGAYLDEGARLLRVRDEASLGTVLAFARSERGLEARVSIGARPLATITLPVRFERPADRVLVGPTGAPGPQVAVDVDEMPRGRLVYTTSSGSYGSVVVVEPADVGRFHVLARGGDGALGAAGYSGSSGSDGMSGSDASCPSSSGGDGTSGGPGSDGGPGGPGGAGGQGGEVHARVHCDAAVCAEIERVLAMTLLAPGGAGGPGGRGGAGGSGGRGGRGGSGATCTDSDGNSSSLSGGNNGSDGASGSDGPDGPDGPAGAPGHVTIELEPRP